VATFWNQDLEWTDTTWGPDERRRVSREIGMHYRRVHALPRSERDEKDRAIHRCGVLAHRSMVLEFKMLASKSEHDLTPQQKEELSTKKNLLAKCLRLAEVPPRLLRSCGIRHDDRD